MFCRYPTRRRGRAGCCGWERPVPQALGHADAGAAAAAAAEVWRSLGRAVGRHFDLWTRGCDRDTSSDAGRPRRRAAEAGWFQTRTESVLPLDWWATATCHGTNCRNALRAPHIHYAMYTHHTRTHIRIHSNVTCVWRRNFLLYTTENVLINDDVSMSVGRLDYVLIVYSSMVPCVWLTSPIFVLALRWRCAIANRHGTHLVYDFMILLIFTFRAVIITFSLTVLSVCICFILHMCFSR